MKIPASSCVGLLACCIVLLPQARSADANPGTSPLTLEAAVRRTLEQSPAVRISNLEIERREGVREQASGEFDVITSANAVREKDRVPTVDPLGRDAVVAGDSTSYSVGAAHKLRNGIVVEPSVAVTVPTQSSPYAAPYGTSQLNLQIMVPLLRGLGRASSGAAEAAARGDVEVARLLYRHALAQQTLATVQAYWSARAAEAALVVQREDEDRAKKLDQGVRVLVDTHVFPPNLLLQSEANLRQKSTATHNAELQAFNARFTLARVMGLPAAEVAGAPLPADPLPQEVTVLAPPTHEERINWINRALSHRADYLAARQSQVPLRILSRQAELDLKPRLDLTVRGGYIGYNQGRDLVAPLSRRLTGANGELGLGLEWPAANTFQRGLLHERRAAERQAELSTAQTQVEIAADVCAALEEVRLRAETTRNASATSEIARKAVEQEQHKLRSGEATVLDVINLENLLSQARLSEIDAQSGYAIAVTRLRFTLGEIFTNEQTDHSFQLSDLNHLPTDEK